MKSWQSLLTTAFLVASTFAVAKPAEAQVSYIINDSFEGSSIGSPWQLSSGDGCCSHSRTTSTDWANTGSKSFKSLIKDADTSYRAEIARHNFAPAKSENYVGFVVRFGAGEFENFTSFFQFHQSANGSWPSPPFFTYTRNNQITLRRHAVSTTGSGSNQEWNLGSISEGMPIQFVYHVKASAGSDGFMKVYRDGVLMVNYSGPTQKSTTEGYSLKFGQYLGSGNTRSQDTTMYFDDIKVTGASGSVAAVTSR